MLPVKFHDLASRELDAAIDYYESQSQRTANGFIDAMNRLTDRISEDPLQFPRHEDFAEIRIAASIKYPFSQPYRQRTDHVQILAVAHASRQEDYWADRQDD